MSLLKIFSRLHLFLIAITILGCSQGNEVEGFKPTNKNCHFVGRFVFNEAPTVWAPGAYIEFYFSGDKCSVEITDQSNYNYHNYIEVILDELPVRRFKLNNSKNIVEILRNGKKGIHHVIITKCTEARIGSISFTNVYCEKLVKLKKKKKLLFEFIGDSMTCGNGANCYSPNDVRGAWYEQHATYRSYGPTLARKCKADWILTAVSGFGLTRSCCGKEATIPEVYEFADLSLQEHPFPWAKIHPDVFFVCLGQNDGMQKTQKFSFELVKFIKRLKKVNPEAKIICLDSPMAKKKLKTHLDQCIRLAAKTLTKNYGSDFQYYFFKKRYFNGRLLHPNLNEHREIAAEISKFIASNKHFKKLIPDL